MDAYVEELRKIPGMARLDGAFVANGVGGISTDLQTIARTILARSISTGNVEETCRAFVEFLRTNKIRATAVLGVSGVSVVNEVKLGPDVIVRRMESLPPFYQRGAALCQPGAMPPSRSIVPTAITTDFDFGPVIYFPSERPASPSIREAQDKVEEAMLLMSVLGAYPNVRMFWVQPQDLLFSSGLGAGWQIGAESLLQHEARLEEREACELGNAYFALDETVRTKYLRIPLDRLNRAGRERDPTDRAIDLGIALEALLLHEQKEGELSFRLAMRGAWLVGSSAKQREQAFNLLRSLYNLRSTAVHSGEFSTKPNARNDLRDGLSLCQRLIEIMIDKKCVVNWNSLVLGEGLEFGAM